jgi:dipeptidyl aminopeptidase/acylaminoacyl peptidase
MPRTLRALASAALVFLCCPAFAEESKNIITSPVPTVSDESRWTVDDILMAEVASPFGMDLSPDCQWLAWVKSQHTKDHGNLAHIYRTRLADGKEVQLTRGIQSCTSPRWSPDGSRLAFLSTRPAPDAKPGKSEEGPKPRLWLIDPFGGEPWLLSDHGRAVMQYHWADPDTIIFSAQEDPSWHESSMKDDKKDSSILVDDEDHAPPVRLYKVNVKNNKVRRLTDNKDRIQTFAVSPEGVHVVAIHERSLRHLYDEKIKPVVMLHNLEKGESKPIFTEPHFTLSDVAWAPDGKGFYAESGYTTHPQYRMALVMHLYYFDLASGKATQVPLNWERGLAGAVKPTSTGFLALLANGVRPIPARYTRAGDVWKRDELSSARPGTVGGWQLGKDQETLVCSLSTSSQPSQLVKGRLQGGKIEDVAPLTHLNGGLDKKTLSKTEVVHWKGALDEEVEGLLYYPHGYQQGKKYPLVVMIHGGPAFADLDVWVNSWGYPHQLFTQRGAFILKVNYHGSTGYGLKWVESIANGKYYDLEVPDIEKGVDALIARGMVDPDKLGVMGWSNGSILSIAITTTTTRYKVASCGAGEVDWVSDWGNCEFGAAFDNYYFGKSPLEDRKVYLDKSPFYKLDKVRTPTLIFFGTEDHNVPTQQGWMHYRALQQLGNTDVRFILFPGEGHGPAKLVHQRRKLDEELAWFDKYLFKTCKDSNEAFKPDSPLAQALKLQGLRREGGKFGGKEKDLLVPETVLFNKLDIGRFEVTRAQFALFDKSYKVEAGKENYPANGITFKQAQDYCAWLSKETGKTYRLPTQEEAEKLEEAAAKPENTLDYWAGYTVNPDDAARLQAKLRDLTGPGALLKEVGSFPGAGKEEKVFDLGGNVAEWCVSKDGNGKVYGASADTPSDAKMATRKPAPEYIGFRIIKEPGVK